MATMYNTHQGVNHATVVTHMLYYIIVIIILVTTTTTIVIIVKINIASFDVFVIIVYHYDAIRLGYEAAPLGNQFSAYRSVFVHTDLE